MNLIHQFVRVAASRSASAARGQTLVEYGLLLAFIALAVIAVLLVFGPGVTGLYQRFFDKMP